MRDGWVEATLRDALEPIANRPDGKDYPLVLSVTEKRGIIPQTEIFKHRIATDDISKYKVLEPMDIAYNPYLLWCGAIGQWQGSEAGVVSPVYECFRVKSNCEPRYLGYIFETGILTNYFDALAIGSIVRRRRTIPSDFIAAPIQLPPLSEQKRIVDLVSSVDSYIEALQQHVDSAKRSRNAVLHELLNAGGDDWTETTLGQEFEICKNGKNYKDGISTEGLPITRIQTIAEGKIDLAKVGYGNMSAKDAEGFLLEEGDILFSHINSLPHVGKVARVQKSHLPLIHGMNLLRMRFRNSNDTNFMFYLMQNEIMRDEIKSRAQVAVNQVSINISSIKTIKIVIPPLRTQKEIASLIGAWDNLIEECENNLNSSQNLRVSLLSELLSGEHEIPASYDEFMGAA